MDGKRRGRPPKEKIIQIKPQLFMACGSCDFKVPTAPPKNIWAFGRHLLHTGHQHGGIVDENNNMVKLPPELKDQLSTEEPTTNKSLKGDGKGSLLRGQVVGKTIYLDLRLQFLYDVLRTNFPEYNESMEEWLYHSVILFHKEHFRELKLYKLYPELFPEELLKVA